jgi:hypothetical protein
MQNRILILFLLLILTSCKKCKEKETDKLCTSTLQPVGSALRLDGYYYHMYNPPNRSIIFLYQSGVLLYGGSISEDQVAGFETRYANGDYYNVNKDNLMVWGNFRISQNLFFLERWYPSTNNLIAYVSEGEILNDSTFRITKSHRCDGSSNNVEDETWHFKQFGPKPDSTNEYIP